MFKSLRFRWAFWLSLLAVFSALWMPVSMLAQEAGTGQLGGICTVRTLAFTDDGAAPAQEVASGLHCDLCGTLGLGLPSLPVLGLPFVPYPLPLAPACEAEADAAVAGLPFSRGPPSL